MKNVKIVKIKKTKMNKYVFPMAYAALFAVCVLYPPVKVVVEYWLNYVFWYGGYKYYYAYLLIPLICSSVVCLQFRFYREVILFFSFYVIFQASIFQIINIFYSNHFTLEMYVGFAGGLLISCASVWSTHKFYKPGEPVVYLVFMAGIISVIPHIFNLLDSLAALGQQVISGSE